MSSKNAPTPFNIAGVDIYQSSKNVYYGLFALSLLYVVLLFLQWVTVQNITIAHTYFSNPTSPGTLFSQRYISVGAVAIELLSTRIFLFLSLLCLIIFRKEQSWSIFWMAMITLLVICQVVAFFMLCAEYARANNQGNRYGLASDPWFCCDPERHANPLNLCMNTYPCGSPVWTGFEASDLRINSPFFYMFLVNLFLFLIDVGILAWLGILWSESNKYAGYTQPQQPMEEEEEDEGDDEEYYEEEKYPPQVMPSAAPPTESRVVLVKTNAEPQLQSSVTTAGRRKTAHGLKK